MLGGSYCLGWFHLRRGECHGMGWICFYRQGLGLCLVVCSWFVILENFISRVPPHLPQHLIRLCDEGAFGSWDAADAVVHTCAVCGVLSGGVSVGGFVGVEIAHIRWGVHIIFCNGRLSGSVYILRRNKTVGVVTPY